MLSRFMSIPDVAVNVSKAQGLGFFALKLVPWAVPGAMFAAW